MSIEIEDQQTEWKETWRDDYLKWVCGFANAEGGRLIIGKTDRGLAVGVANARELLENLPNKIRDTMGILVEINFRLEQDTPLIEIHVPAYPNPISYKGKFYFRSGSTLQELNGNGLQRFLMRKQGIRWDSVPVPQAHLDELDPLAFKRFREWAQRAQRLDSEALKLNNTELLDKLRLLDEGKLKRAAVLLFHPEPDRYISGATIKMGYFSDLDEVVYQDEIQGPLVLQVEQAMQALRLKYLRGWISYEGLQRIETYPVPLEALREALLNAVIHKDYSSSTPIQLRIYNHQVRLANTGQLPENWTVEKLLSAHNSQPYNPDIAYCFFRAGQIERWGQGITKILRLCQQAGLPSPLYEFDSGFCTLSLTSLSPPLGMPKGGLSIESHVKPDLENKYLLNPQQEHSDRVNVQSDRVNVQSDRAFTQEENKSDWENVWEEVNQKAYHFQNPLFNPKTKQLEKPTWSSPIIHLAVENFGGTQAILNLETSDEDGKQRFIALYLDILKKHKPDSETLMLKSIQYFRQNYKQQFKKVDYYENIERLLAKICLQEGLRTQQYAQLLGIATASLSRYVKELKKLDIICFVGAFKTGGYYLTDTHKKKIGVI